MLFMLILGLEMLDISYLERKEQIVKSEMITKIQIVFIVLVESWLKFYVTDLMNSITVVF